MSTRGFENPHQASQFLEVTPKLVYDVFLGKKSLRVHNAIAKKTGLLDPLPESREIQVCEKCGEVHTQYGTCDDQRMAAYRRRYRRAIEFESREEAEQFDELARDFTGYQLADMFMECLRYGVRHE